MQYSLLVCTYNPIREVFSRVLSSLAALDTTGIEAECIIVDNNSTNNFSSEPYFNEFLRSMKYSVQVIKESQPGLTFARLKGYTSSKGDTIIFVDDDNYLASDYLLKVKELHEKFPHVYCWGPGTVEVELPHTAEKWVNDFRWIFQQKKMKDNEYGYSRNWNFFSPPGTGLVVKRSVMDKYSELCRAGVFNASDRSGASLESGGDSQIIHASTMMEKCSGLAPALKVIHIIDKRKSNLHYMKRLLFNVNSSIYVHAEAFPELKKRLIKIPSKLEYIFFIISTIVNNKFGFRKPHLILALSGYLGIINGSYIILSQELPFQFRFLVKMLKLK